ncbi:hypothetical protein H0H92_014411 [Tricholoma furcatifolium]|nr:hypothetical protein H0H92_014411 [Tricholoma furcatifolium]
MHFSTIVALSIAACASSTLARHYPADSSLEPRTWPSGSPVAAQVKGLPVQLQASIRKQMEENSRGAVWESPNRRLRRSDDLSEREIPDFESSLEARVGPSTSSLAEHVRKLPTEIKNMIGDHMYESAKNGAERTRYRAAGVPQSGASRQQTAARVSHSRFQGGVNSEIKNGQPRRASEGLRAILDNNRRLRRSDIDDYTSLEARTEDESLEENMNKLPNELKIKVGDQMYEGAKSKAATARYREAGVPQSEASRQKIKAVKAHEKLQKGVNDEVRNGNLPNAGQGLRRIVTGNRRLRREYSHDGELELLIRDIVDEYFANL